MRTKYALFEREAKDRLTAEASTLGFPVGQAPKEFVIPDYPADQSHRTFKLAEPIESGEETLGWDYVDVLTGKVFIRVWND
jgi:hypothetical protein